MLINVLDQGDELLAAVACQNVTFSERTLNSADAGAQGFIPDLMAIRVVDLLEVIKIYQEHCVGCADFLLILLEEVAAIEDPGEWIRLRLNLQVAERTLCQKDYQEHRQSEVQDDDEKEDRNRIEDHGRWILETDRSDA